MATVEEELRNASIEDDQDAADNKGTGGTKDKAKWLEGAFKKNDQPQGSSSGCAEPGSDLVKSRMDAIWGSKKKDKDEQEKPRAASGTEDPGHQLASDRKKWLENAFKKGDSNEKPVSGTGAPGNALVSDRMKWLQEQANKKGDSGEKPASGTEAPSKTLVADRANQIWGKKDQQEENAPTASGTQAPGSALVSDRMKWLQEQAHKKDERPVVEVAGDTAMCDGGGEHPVEQIALGDSGGEAVGCPACGQKFRMRKNASVAETAPKKPLVVKKREERENKPSASGTEAPGNALVTDRMKWLEEQAHKKDEPKESSGTEAPGNALVGDRMKWLEEQANKKDEGPRSTGTEAPGNALVTDRMKWLQEQANKKDEPKESGAAAEEMSHTLVADRTNQIWGKKDEDEEGPRATGAEDPGHQLVTDRMEWLKGKAFASHERPVVEVAGDTAMCDGGGEHDIEQINVGDSGGEAVGCPRCGQKYRKRGGGN